MSPDSLSFEQVLADFQEARARMLTLTALLNDAELRGFFVEGFSPPGWHLGHVALFEERWILKQGDDRASSPVSEPRFSAALFDPLQSEKQLRGQLPPRDALRQWVDEVRTRSLERLSEDAHQLAREPSASFSSRPELLRNFFVYRLVIDHELQHCETVALILRNRPNASREAAARWFRWEPRERLQSGPEPRDDNGRSPYPRGDQNTNPKPLRFEPGQVLCGEASRIKGYDNERPPALREFRAFELDALPVSNAQWLEFIKAGGYREARWWSEEGWAFKEREGVEHPFWWRKDGEDYFLQGFSGDVPLPLNHPVEGISAHEAEAYARWVGKRLPSEAEWEYAAQSSAALVEPHCGMRQGGTRALGESAELLGNVWQWTQDTFAPYPGFKPDPYPEYSQLWFDGGHRVLKGGSWASHPRFVRPAFRNWFHSHIRAPFAGLRCARDA